MKSNKFIILHQIDNKTILVNASKILYTDYNSSSHNRIYFNGKYRSILVKETPEEILKLIKDSKNEV